MSYVEVETGRYVKRWAFWNPATWSIPKLYWDAWSQEQRLHAICRQLEKVIKYADYLGVNVDDIAARLKAIEDGQLDPIIEAAIEAWFEENQPEIMNRLDTIDGEIVQLGDDITLLDGKIDREIGTLTERIDRESYLQNVCRYGADSTGAEDSYDAIMEAAANGNIFFPSGTYKISSPLDFTDMPCYIITGDNAIITTDDELGFMLKMHPNPVSGYNQSTIDGITLDGANIAHIGLYVAQQNIVRNCTIRNFQDVYIKEQGAGNLEAQYVMFSNIALSNNPTLNSANGIEVSDDNVFINCKIWGMDTGVTCGSNNTFIACNFWHFYNTRKRIAIASDGEYHFNKVTSCYFDGMNVCASGFPLQATDCIFLYGETQDNDYDYQICDLTSFDNYGTNNKWRGIKLVNCQVLSVDNTASAKFDKIIPESPSVTVTDCSINLTKYTCPLRNKLVTNNTIDVVNTTHPSSGSGTWYEIATIHSKSASYSFVFDMELATTQSVSWRFYLNNGGYFRYEFLTGTLSEVTNRNFGVVQETVDGITVIHLLFFRTTTESDNQWRLFNVKNYYASGFYTPLDAMATNYTTDQVTRVSAK